MRDWRRDQWSRLPFGSLFCLLLHVPPDMRVIALVPNVMSKGNEVSAAALAAIDGTFVELDSKPGGSVAVEARVGLQVHVGSWDAALITSVL